MLSLSHFKIDKQYIISFSSDFLQEKQKEEKRH